MRAAAGEGTSAMAQGAKGARQTGRKTRRAAPVNNAVRNIIVVSTFLRPLNPHKRPSNYKALPPPRARAACAFRLLKGF